MKKHGGFRVHSTLRLSKGEESREVLSHQNLIFLFNTVIIIFVLILFVSRLISD